VFRFDRYIVNLTLVAIVSLATDITHADVRLPKLVSDNMVLQRDSRVMLWGWADAGESVEIKFQSQVVATKADADGRWFTSIGPFEAGGPYEMTIKGNNSIHLRNILLGDVWLASGQSNMEFPVKASGEWRTGVVNAEQEIARANFPEVRLFKVHQKAAFAPVDDMECDAWIAVTPESVGKFSAVAYLFGKELQQRYGVPIGLIESSWGATKAEAWMSDAALKRFPEFSERVEAVSRANDPVVITEHNRYIKQVAEWYRQHGTEDRGLVDGRAIWAEPSFDATKWPTIVEPQREPEEALKGFDRAVWFRRDITLSEQQTKKELWVHLASAGIADTTYFNGEVIGQTLGWEKPRDYLVPGELVRPGRNVIAVRITGEDGYAGMFDHDFPDKLNVQSGGTNISLAGAWSYNAGPDLTALPRPSMLSKVLNNRNACTVLFNGMISPIVRFRLKGIIWYQGESNTDRPAQYRTLFRALIEDWRKHWGYEVPFLFVQIAGFGPNKLYPAEYESAELREAQAMALALPHTGMATAVDLGVQDDVHPRDKQNVAHRLVIAAARVVYGEDIIHTGPAYQSIQVENNRARIRFANVGSGIDINDKYGYVRGFEIAGANGKFVWAQALLDGSDILVSSKAITHPVAVRYDWTNTPDGNVFNKEGLPATPFRTDAPDR
jgi:sialate O-acetylesterase